MLKLKLQYFGHLMWRVDSLEKTDAGRDWGQEEKGTTEDEMAGWHHWFDRRESEWTPAVGDGQGGLACCDLWGCKESDTTERLNWTELKLVESYWFIVSLREEEEAFITEFYFSELEENLSFVVTNSLRRLKNVDGLCFYMLSLKIYTARILGASTNAAVTEGVFKKNNS